ncbi:hypothetical protein L0156_09920 [bacterium]|nr:hypothetical protein [bacterium]
MILRNYKLPILICVAVTVVFLALLAAYRNSVHKITVYAGPDQTIRGASASLQGAVLNQRPLNFWTGDGNHATEDMLVKYDSRSGVSYVGPLRNPEGAFFGWPSDFARINQDVYGIDADRRRLYKLNADTGICEPLKAKLLYRRVFGLAYDEIHDKLYAVDKVARKVLLLDTLTGDASEVLTLPASHLDIRGLAYNAGDNRIYYSDESTESIYHCDLTIGQPRLLVTFQDGQDTVMEELDFHDGRLFASCLTFRESIWSMQVMEIDAALRTKHPVGPVINDLSGHCLLINSMPARILWRQISGPDRAQFSDPADPQATVEFPQPGTYVLELVAEGTHQIADSVTLKAVF